jgi:hypothetical protein
MTLKSATEQIQENGNLFNGLYSERQKYGINSLKIKQNFFQKNLCTGQF